MELVRVAYTTSLKQRRYGCYLRADDKVLTLGTLVWMLDPWPPEVRIGRDATGVSVKCLDGTDGWLWDYELRPLSPLEQLAAATLVEGTT